MLSARQETTEEQGTFDYRLLDREKAEFIYDAGKQSLAQMAQSLASLEQKTNQTLSLVMTVLSALSGFILVSVTSDHEGQKVFALLEVSVFLTFPLGTSAAFLLCNLFPKKYCTVGHAPSDLFINNFCTQEYPVMLYAECFDYERRIKINKDLMARMSKNLAYGQLITTASLVLAPIVFFGALAWGSR